jgi:hypothetical protein
MNKQTTTTRSNNQYILELRKLKRKFKILDRNQIHKNEPEINSKNRLPIPKRVKDKGKKPVVKGLIPEEYLKDTSRFLNTTALILTWIYGGISSTKYKSMINSIINLYNSLITNHGITEGTRRYKILYTYVYEIIEGKNPANPGWVATDPLNNHLPVSFNELFPLILQIKPTNSMKGYQSLQTILAIPRLSREIPELDLKSVIEPMNPTIKREFETEFCPKFKDFLFKESGLPRTNNIRFELDPSARMTSGPNGDPTLKFSAEEAKLLVNTPHLWKPFSMFCTRTGNKDLLDYLTKFKEINLNVDSIYLGKVALVPDSMNKHRLVAMVDYWTNLVLTPLEGFCKNILRNKFPSDYMYNHDLGARKVKELSAVKPIWSFDLKDFTNRFPARLQQMVLAVITDANIADSWYKMLCHREYWSPKTRTYISYAIGQPMGSKSSFVIASLTHHLLIAYGYYEVHKTLHNFENSYVIIGDDICIFDEKLAKITETIYKACGVEISISKSKLPKPGENWAEFCSRVFHNGIELSRVSPAVILSGSKSWEEIPLLLTELFRRDIAVDPLQLPLIPILQKKDKNQVAYLQHLKDVLVSGTIMYSDNLKILGESLPGPNNWEKYGITHLQVKGLTLNYLVAKSLLVVQAALEEALGRKLPSDYYNLVLLRDPLNGDYRQCRPYETFTHKEEGMNGELITPLSVMSYSMDPIFKTEGWNFDFPHPASIAAVNQVIKLLQFLMKGVPGLYASDDPTDEMWRKFVREVGLSVSAVLPKEAAKLMERDSRKDEYYRHQVFLARTILKAYEQRRNKNTDTLEFKDIMCEFRLPSETDRLENLLVRRIPHGNEEREKDFFSLFAQVVGPPFSHK